MQNKRGTVTIIEGNIGAGKSTFAVALGQALGPDTLVLLEPDERDNQNPYLSDYYADKERWATLLQLHQLHKRFGAQKAAMNQANVFGRHAVLDRSFYGDTCFARMLLKDGIIPKREFETYEIAYHAMTENVSMPNFCVNLIVEPEVCISRIQRRYETREGRKCESTISLDYLRKLDEEIQNTVQVLSACGVHTIHVPYSEDVTASQIEETAIKIAQMITSTTMPDIVRAHMRQA